MQKKKKKPTSPQYRSMKTCWTGFI